MKATGIIRRVDDLGRIVIPREIRRTLDIREGDPMEIFTGDGGAIVLRKYDEVTPAADLLHRLADRIEDSNARCRVTILQKLVEVETLLKEEGKK